MRTRLLAAVLLVVACGRSETHGQTGAVSAGSKPLSPLLLRDAQGKMVAAPEPNPAKPVNYIQWLNDMLSKGVTDNAAELYREAFKLLDDGDLVPDELDKAMTGPWKDLPNLSTWLTADKACLDTFRKATLKRQCYHEIPLADLYDQGLDTWVAASKEPRFREWLLVAIPPHLSAHRTLSKTLVAEGWRDWKVNREDPVIDNTVIVLRGVRHLDDQPALFPHLVGSACVSLVYETLRKALSRSGDADALAQRLVGTLSDAVDPPLDLSNPRWLSYEALAIRDTCQRLFSPGEKQGAWRVSKTMLAVITPINVKDLSFGKVPENADKELAQIGYEATLREFDELFQQTRAFLAKPNPGAAKDGENILTNIENSRNPLVKLAMFTPTHFRRLEERRIANRRATHLVVQLHVYHGKNHTFPDLLDDLKTADLKELRIDPFSGKDFVYKKQDKSFILYSVAQDLKDDGGQHDDSWETGDFVFWPVKP